MVPGGAFRLTDRSFQCGSAPQELSAAWDRPSAQRTGRTTSITPHSTARLRAINALSGSFEPFSQKVLAARKRLRTDGDKVP